MDTLESLVLVTLLRMIRVEVIEERHKTNIHEYIYLLGNIYIRHVYRENTVAISHKFIMTLTILEKHTLMCTIIRTLV